MESAAAQGLAVAIPEVVASETSTIEFYDRHASEYFERTVSADLSSLYQRFLRYLKPDGAILDVGAGSGRDMKAFRERGFEVLGIDGSRQLARRATKFSGATCLPMRFDEMKFRGRFNGAWACASLLHVPKAVLPSVLHRLSVGLKRDGVLFVSMRQGDGEATAEDGRFFAYYETEEVRRLVADAGFRIDDLWVSRDQLGDRDSIEWINLIALKSNLLKSKQRVQRAG